MSAIGIGVLAGWQVSEVPLVVSILAYVIIMLLALPAWFLVRKTNVFSVTAGGLLVSLAGAVQVVVLGLDYEEITIIKGIPEWPGWVGILFIIMGPVLIFSGISFFYEYAENLFDQQFIAASKAEKSEIVKKKIGRN